jgi:hypothetical protein
LEVSEAAYHRWGNQYAGMKADDARRLREFERENARLKRIVADQALEAQALKEIAASAVASMMLGGRRLLRVRPSPRR